MKRRSFIAALGGAAAWPIVAWGQQGERVKRVGVLMALDESNPPAQLQITNFLQGLAKLGWIDGRNLTADYRWAAGDIARMHTFAAELVALHPDVLLVVSTPATTALRQATNSIPIVFIALTDPVSNGFVTSLSRPGGNLTGFTAEEPPLASKWVQFLKKVAPNLRRAAMLFNPDQAPFAGEFYSNARAAAASLEIDIVAAAVHTDRDIENTLALSAREPNSGIVVGLDAFTASHIAGIAALTARYQLPAIYPSRNGVGSGGLISYGVNLNELFGQAASYVDRILRGEKPADLPVQAPTKYELVINLKTARSLGLGVSRDMLSIADEVIE
jgi:putative ABC transport system substrate-binding protein